MSLSLSGPDRSALLALMDLYRDWGVDYLVAEHPLQRLDRPTLMRHQAHAPKPHAARLETSPTIRPAPVDAEAAHDWGVEHLPDCALAHTASKTVRPLTIAHASLMLIGDTPDADEDRSGVVFSGETGRILDMILPSIALDRATLSQAPAIPWRPPGGRPVSPMEIHECRPLIYAAIAQAKPERIVTFGQTPLRLLIDEQATISRLRGKWVCLRLGNGTTIEMLAMQHPLQLLSSARARREMWKDLIFLAKTLDSRTEG